jgi:hypothetical protein
MKKKEDERKRRRRNELVRRRKRKKMKGGGGAVIVHLADAEPVLTRAKITIFGNLLNTKAGNAADLRAYAGRAAAVLVGTLMEWSIKMILVLPPSLHFQIMIIKIPTMILVLNPCTRLVARKLTNDHTVVLYSEGKEVLWLLSCKTESNLVSLAVVKSDCPRTKLLNTRMSGM